MVGHFKILILRTISREMDKFIRQNGEMVSITGGKWSNGVWG